MYNANKAAFKLDCSIVSKSELVESAELERTDVFKFYTASQSF